MNRFENPPRRAAPSLRTPLLIAAGLLGVPLAIGLANYWGRDPDPVPGSDPAAPVPPTVDENTEYPANHFLPGAGYYHPPYRTWFPMPFNFHDPGRGWFRGGAWRSAATEDDAERREIQRTSGFASSTSSGAAAVRPLASRPLPSSVKKANSGAATQHKSNVIRGGFGSSSRPGLT